MKKQKFIICFVLLLLLSCSKRQVIDSPECMKTLVKLTDEGIVADNEEFMLAYASGLSLLAEAVFLQNERKPEETEKIAAEGREIFSVLFKRGTTISTDNGGFFFKTKNNKTIYFTMNQDSLMRKFKTENPKARLSISFKINSGGKDVIKQFKEKPASELSDKSQINLGLITVEDFNKLNKFYGSIEIWDALSCKLLSIK